MSTATYTLSHRGGAAVDEVLTAAEVAAEWRVAPRTIYRMVRSGGLAGHRVGRSYRFLRSEVTAAMRYTPPVGATETLTAEQLYALQRGAQPSGQLTPG